MAGPKGVGLTKWFDQKWVNIGAPKKKGKYQPCGTSGAGRRVCKMCTCCKGQVDVFGPKEKCCSKKKKIRNA